MFEKVTVEIATNRPVSEAWRVFTSPECVTEWNFASDDWCCPAASNDLAVNGTFNYRMESRDGKYGFDFTGAYTKIIDQREINYELGDGRRVKIEFIQDGDAVIVRETFDAEGENSAELQRTGWQSILDNFKRVLERA